jgi:hypothetical protein
VLIYDQVLLRDEFNQEYAWYWKTADEYTPNSEAAKNRSVPESPMPGTHDMHGSCGNGSGTVSELRTSAAEETDPLAPHRQYRTYRGGAWSSESHSVRSATAMAAFHFIAWHLTFRVLRDSTMKTICDNLEDKYIGCLLGLPMRCDGTPYEGRIIERLVWRFIGKDCRRLSALADDTQRSLDSLSRYGERRAFSGDLAHACSEL